MSEAARSAILSRLRKGGAGVSPTPLIGADATSALPSVERLRTLMEAVKTEFLEATHDTWPAAVREFCEANGIRNLLCGTNLHIDGALTYDRPIEEWKADLFAKVDAAVTTTRGAIASTGSLILWPSKDEPRLMSLVPPVHIALLETNAIYETFGEVMRKQEWAAGMPPNALLISGPSKTADIEQTLAYGVHGPKRLVVVLIS